MAFCKKKKVKIKQLSHRPSVCVMQLVYLMMLSWLWFFPLLQSKLLSVFSSKILSFHPSEESLERDYGGPGEEAILAYRP